MKNKRNQGAKLLDEKIFSYSERPKKELKPEPIGSISNDIFKWMGPPKIGIVSWNVFSVNSASN